MSDKPVQGLDRDLAEKAAAKYDPKREAEAREFIEIITKEKFSSDSFQESLKDGVLLCKCMNIILPSDPIKISTSRIPFKQMENIGFFLNRLNKIGVPTYDQFQTVDLYEGKNVDQVVNCLFSLSRHAAAKGCDVPILGPKLSTKTERNFTEEQLNQSKSILPRFTNFVAKVDGPGPFGGRREIGGTYLENPADVTVDAVTEDVGKVSLTETITEKTPEPTPVATSVPTPVAPVRTAVPIPAPTFVAPNPAPAPAPTYTPQVSTAPSVPTSVSSIAAPSSGAVPASTVEADSAFDRLDRIVREAEEEIQRAKDVAAIAKKKEEEERQAYKARIAAYAPTEIPRPCDSVAEEAIVSPSAIADSYIDSYYGEDDDDVEEVVIIEEDDDEGQDKVMYSSGSVRTEE
ncbi:hypothetical protein HDU67_003253 [Dinochytrium kinnereticum]|nr:hypothetical protein HDU67_003253 [Dinochytrium kinnereticum]